MTNTPPVSSCKLCGTVATLQWSHIIPQWTYRRTGPNPVQIFDNIAIVIPHQDAEYMLCDVCEAVIEPAEKYVSEIAVQHDGSFPGLDLVRIEQQEGDLKIADASALDVEKLVNFACSVIWRASVSTFEHYGSVKLGRYEREFADYLLGKATFPSKARVMVEFLDAKVGPNISALVIKPEVVKNQTYRVYHFCTFGIMFRLQLGSVLPATTPVSAIADTKKLLVSDGRRVLGAVGKKVMSVTPKGKRLNKK